MRNSSSFRSNSLINNSLPPDFIKELKFQITTSSDRTIKCRAYAKGINDRIYEAGHYFEKSYEVFDAFHRPSRWEIYVKRMKFWSYYLRLVLSRKFKFLRPTLRYTKRLDPNQEIRI